MVVSRATVLKFISFVTMFKVQVGESDVSDTLTTENKVFNVFNLIFRYVF